MYDVIKRVTRIEDRKGEDAIVFKDEEGKIAYLDRAETNTSLNINETYLVWVVSSKERYNFVKTTIGGTKNVERFINDIPKLLLSDFTTRNNDFIAFINDFNNHDKKYNEAQYYTDVTLDNLQSIVEYYDKIGVNNEFAEWVCNSIDTLQYIYEEYNTNQEYRVRNITLDIEKETIEEKIARVKKEFHEKDEFDMDLAIEIHRLEKMLNTNLKTAKTKFKTIISLLDKGNEFSCIYGSRDYVYTIKNVSRHNFDAIEMFGTNENGFKSFTINDDEGIIDFINNVKSINKIEKVWEND